MLAQFRVLVQGGALARVGVLEDVLKLLELRVAEAFLDVEGQWKLSVVLDAQGLKVDSDVVEQSLLVGEMVVVLLLAVGQQVV